MKQLRFLHVDDQDFLGRAVKRSLMNAVQSMNGFLNASHQFTLKVTTCTSAEEALESLSENIPSLIISDYDMPSMNGVEFYTLVRERFRENMPDWVFASGSLGDSPKLDTLVRREKLQTLEKPFKPKDIEELLLLHLWRTRYH